MATDQVEFRIYVADLHEYVNGRLVGRWVVPSECADAEELQAAVTACMTDPSHEHAYHDSEGVKIREHESAEDIMHISEAVEEYGTEKVNHFLDQGRITDMSDLREAIADADLGEWDDEEAWACDYIDSCYDLEKMLGNLACYFDYEAFARDAELNGDVTFIPLSNGQVWALGQ